LYLALISNSGTLSIFANFIYLFVCKFHLFTSANLFISSVFYGAEKHCYIL
jgi:hypothetical protein